MNNNIPLKNSCVEILQVSTKSKKITTFCGQGFNLQTGEFLPLNIFSYNFKDTECGISIPDIIKITTEGQMESLEYNSSIFKSSRRNNCKQVGCNINGSAAFYSADLNASFETYDKKMRQFLLLFYKNALVSLILLVII